MLESNSERLKQTGPERGLFCTMAKKRMFTPNIVGSDAFVDMPMSAQALYFHLCLHADDDGFISRPKQIMRMVGANEDDLRILVAKRFLIDFDSGVAVVKHWLIHNLIRADLYVETTYKKEKETLGLNEFGAYTELRDGVLPLQKVEEPTWLIIRRSKAKAPEVKPQPVIGQTVDVPQTVHNRLLGKVRLGKVSKDIYVNSQAHSRVSEILKNLIKELGYSETTKLTDGRKAKLKARLKVYTEDEVLEAARNLANDAYMQGDNDGGKKYGNIDYLLRNDEQIDKWLSQATAGKLNFKADW